MQIPVNEKDRAKDARATPTEQARANSHERGEEPSNKAGSSTAATTNPKRLRVLSYNIHKGFTFNNSQYILSEIRHAIRHVDAELVFLQEVLGEHEKHHLQHSNWIPGAQFEYLADEIWHHFAYGKNAIYQHGHHGNAILCKLPFRRWENTDVSTWRFSQRGLLHGVVGENIHVFCVHLGLVGVERKRQVKQLIDTVREKVPHDEPLIIAGDFNDWKCSIDHRLRNELGLKEVFKELRGKPARTFPAPFPLFQLDRIYYRGLEVIEGKRLREDHWKGLSDHCGLYADFRIP